MVSDMRGMRGKVPSGQDGRMCRGKGSLALVVLGFRAELVFR